jgi:hypothetical protein
MNPSPPFNLDTIKKMADNKKFYSLLKMRFDSFPLLTFFVDYFIDNRAMDAIQKDHEKAKTKQCSSISHLLGGRLPIISNSVRNLFKNRIKKHYDVLFVSRRRSAQVKINERLITSDYLFWSIFEEMSEKERKISKALIIDDLMKAPGYDNVIAYSFVDFLYPHDIIRSLIKSFEIRGAWIRIEKGIISEFSKLNLNGNLFTGFFSLKNLMLLCLLDISITNYTKMLAPKIVIYNDDALFFKSNNKMRLCVLQSARLSWDKEQCMQGFYDAFNLDEEYYVDCSFVHGDYYRKFSQFMTRFGDVIVTGQPRYDIVHDANSVYSKESFCRRYNIKSDNKIILWDTQSHGLSNEENTKSFEAVFGAMQKLKGATLIVKQHPAEGEEYTKIMSGYIRDYEIDALITPKNSDTLEQIFVSDLMITRASTAAIEAVALNKPVIVLNLSGEPDPVEYVKEGVACGVYKRGDLEPAILKLLEEDPLSKSRKQYIRKYLYEIDGKATERVVDIIRGLVEIEIKD